MGRIVHDAIVVTSWNKVLIAEAHEKARSLMTQVSEIIESPTNNYLSFLIAPDGSKEGWEESGKGDIAREAFIEWVDDRAYEDGSNALVYAAIRYGESELSVKSNAD